MVLLIIPVEIKEEIEANSHLVDLILESYEKALSLTMDQALLSRVEKGYIETIKRKNKLDKFWK